MKLAVLFSGGKDSVYALHKALEGNTVSCLISIVSTNKESYMFHTPNISVTSLQAEAIGIPLIRWGTVGVKEEELSDLEDAIVEARDKYGIEGVVTGAVESVYQASRVQKICQKLSLWCLNPLWRKDQLGLLKDIVGMDFEVIISGIFAYPLDESWLGRRIDDAMIDELEKLYEEYELNPAGEGGEIETTVLDAPFFKKRLVVEDFSSSARNNSGVYVIKKASLVGK